MLNKNQFNQIPAISLLFRMGGLVVGGLPAGVIETKTNSVQIQLNLPVGTELGKINSSGIRPLGFLFLNVSS